MRTMGGTTGVIISRFVAIPMGGYGIGRSRLIGRVTVSWSFFSTSGIKSILQASPRGSNPQARWALIAPVSSEAGEASISTLTRVPPSLPPVPSPQRRQHDKPPQPMPPPPPCHPKHCPPRPRA